MAAVLLTESSLPLKLNFRQICRWHVPGWCYWTFQNIHVQLNWGWRVRDLNCGLTYYSIWAGAKSEAILTFREPCIVIYSYNKTNEMHWFLKFIFGMKLHVSDSFSVNHQESSTVHTAVGICHTVLDSGWWTESLSETCRVLFQK
jgi:hypothetical protein